MHQELRNLRQDLARYSRLERFSEPVIFVHLVYRLGRAALDLPSPARQVASVVYGVLHLVARVVSNGVDLPRHASIGPGLRLWHGGPTLVNSRATIGTSVDLGHGVVVAPVDYMGDCPVIEDGVVLSSHAHVIGGVRIGAGSKVGAMSVVMKDLPEGVVAAGIPAKVFGPRSS